MKIAIPAQTALSAFHFVSTEATRYYLNGICVEPHKAGGIIVTATDGHALLSIHTPDGETSEKQAIIHLSKAARAALKPNRNDGNLTRYLAIDGDTARIVLSTTPGSPFNEADPEYRVIGMYPLSGDDICIIDGTFPDWRRVVPTASKKAEPAHFCFNPALLVRFQKAFPKAFISVACNDERGPILIGVNLREESKDTVCGVIMPARGNIMTERPAFTLSD